MPGAFHAGASSLKTPSMTARGALPSVRESCWPRWLPPAALGSRGLPERLRRLPKQEVATRSSADSPILSRVAEEPWTGEAELERICSLAERDHDGRIPFSLVAKGLVTEDLEDKFWRWTLLTKGRVENPPARHKDRSHHVALASPTQGARHLLVLLDPRRRHGSLTEG